MTLGTHEKAALQILIAELIEADEPEAMFRVLLRVADRMAHRALKRQDSPACEKWLRVESSLKQLLGMNRS